MSLPSYQLFKEPDGVWICSGAMPNTGRPFRFEVGGKGVSREKADTVAQTKLRHRVTSSEGSRQRWARDKQEGIRAKAPRPPKPSRGKAPPAAEASELRAKLLGLGRPAPAVPDAVYPADAGGEPSGVGDDDPPLDSEGQEMIAGLLAKAATLGVVWLANRPLRRRKPPCEGEPHEKGLEWFHDGMEYHMQKLIGRTATLGPTGKMLAGAAIIFGSVWMTAEPIAGAATEPATAGSSAPAAADPPVAASAMGSPAQPSNGTALARHLPIGVFGVEKTVVGN